MTAAEKLNDRFEKLPQESQAEILVFFTYIEEKERRIAELERQDLDEAIRRDKEMDEGINVIDHEEFMKIIYS